MNNAFSKHKAMQADDGTWSILDVPFFWGGKHHGKKYDEKWLDAAIESFNTLKENSKRLPRLILGHTAPGVEKKAVGLLDNMKRVGNSLVADLVRMKDAVFNEIKDQEWTGRSAETLFDDKRITALALLGGSEPFFDEIEPIEVFSAAENAEWITFEKGIAQEIQDRVTRSEQDRTLNDVWWTGKDMLEQIGRDLELTSEEKQAKAKELLGEMINLLQSEGEKYINTFERNEGDIPMETLTKEQHDAIVAAEVAKANKGYVDNFAKEHGMTPEETLQKFEAMKTENVQITDSVRKNVIEQFCASLKRNGMAPAVVDAFETIRVHLPDEKKVEKFSADGDELTVGQYLDQLMFAVLSYAKENKLIVPDGERGEQQFDKLGGDNNKSKSKADDEAKKRQYYQENKDQFEKMDVTEDDFVKYGEI